MLQQELDALNKKAEDPSLWQNQEQAGKLLQEKSRVEKKLEEYKKLSGEFKDNLELLELFGEDEDKETLEETKKSIINLAKNIKQKQIECMFNGEADSNDCFMEIHPGAGGTESQDWAEILLRMYLRWIELRGFSSEIIEAQEGDEAGLKSATLKISGTNAYGWCKSESGIHRLVRISPFDSNKRRHTSFASVWVYPVVDDSIDIQVDEKDLRIDTYRASGAGGQHVNKTDSAIRITHIPTNIVVQCQSSRSQHRNRAEAFNMLKSKLYELELQKREEEANKANATKTEIGWGHQIRNYVLHPYQLIKDLRSGYETSNTSGILDGNLDEMIMETLVSMKDNSK